MILIFKLTYCQRQVTHLNLLLNAFAKIEMPRTLNHQIKGQGLIRLIEVSRLAEFTAYSVAFAGPFYDGILYYFRAFRVIQGEFQSDLFAFPEFLGSYRAEPDTARGDILYEYPGPFFAFWQYTAMPDKVDPFAEGRSAFNNKS